jgi:hypothetical protein
MGDRPMDAQEERIRLLREILRRVPPVPPRCAPSTWQDSSVRKLDLTSLY